MKAVCCTLAVSLAALHSLSCSAQSEALDLAARITPASADGSAACPPKDSSLPEAPGVIEKSEASRAKPDIAGKVSKRSVHPFSSVAVGVTVGLAGFGVELATPLAQRFNLRGGADFFTYNPNLVEDGIDIQGDIELRSGTLSLDVFPFNNSFRISPGVTLYNGDHIHAIATVPGGQEFDPGDGSYISDPADPVHGTFDVTFGKTIAPRLTMGFGNMIPRKGGHWSVPFEVGVEYIGRKPAATLNLVGSVCQPGVGCGEISNYPDAEQNITEEQNEINGNIPTQLRFFPILSLGLSYRFGHSGTAER